MNDINKKILDLILSECSLDTLVKETGLTYKQVYSRIRKMKDNGYNILNKYYECGSISYSLQKELVNDNQNNEEPQNTTILTKVNSNDFTALLISDIHLGSEFDRIDLLKAVYEFCSKNNINIIINAGDFLDGSIGSIKKVPDFNDQISYALKNHPFDEHILNFICLGNHDISLLTYNGIDVYKALNKRFDLIPIGYGVGKINIKNDYFFVRHPLGIPAGAKSGVINEKLIIDGHIHQAKINNHYPNMHVYAPTLSNIMFENSGLPGFFKMNIEFQTGYFCKIQFEHFIFNNLTPIKINEFNMLVKNSFQIGKINNEAMVPKLVNKTLEQNQKSLVKTMSQTDRFYARYGR